MLPGQLHMEGIESSAEAREAKLRAMAQTFASLPPRKVSTKEEINERRRIRVEARKK